jgi:hypothetical protein
MTVHRYLAWITASLLMTGLVGACEAKTLPLKAEAGQDSGTSSTVVGSACVDIEVAPADVSCNSDSDCELGLTGHVCEGQCDCGDTPLNAAAAERNQSKTASLIFEGCPCADPGEPRCLGGQCTLCGFGPNEPAGCSDAGVNTLEDGGVATADAGGLDTGISKADGGNCVDINVAPSDLSCASDLDCSLVRTGDVCSGQCSCGDTAVNATASSHFQSETASLTLKACPCAFPGEARCVGGQCTLCGPGPGPSAGCSNTGTAGDDSGTGNVDGGGPGISTGDGGRCVGIELSTYDQSCSDAADCILIQTGEVCSGQCACGGQPVSISEQPRYEQATSGIAFGLCGCPVQAAPQCIAKKCVVPAVLPP